MKHKTLKCIGMILVVLISSPDLFSEESSSEFPQEVAIYNYDNYSLLFSYDISENGYTRKIDHKIFKYDLFGLEKSLVNLLKNSPGAKKEVESFEENSFMGNILFWGGFIVGIAFLPPFTMSFLDTTVSGIVSIAGMGTMMGGMIVMIKANAQMRDAVWHYNKDLLSGAVRPDLEKEVTYNVEVGTKF